MLIFWGRVIFKRHIHEVNHLQNLSCVYILILKQSLGKKNISPNHLVAPRSLLLVEQTPRRTSILSHYQAFPYANPFSDKPIQIIEENIFHNFNCYNMRKLPSIYLLLQKKNKYFTFCYMSSRFWSVVCYPDERH